MLLNLPQRRQWHSTRSMARSGTHSSVVILRLKMQTTLMSMTWMRISKVLSHRVCATLIPNASPADLSPAHQTYERDFLDDGDPILYSDPPDQHSYLPSSPPPQPSPPRFISQFYPQPRTFRTHIIIQVLLLFTQGTLQTPLYPSRSQPPRRNRNKARRFRLKHNHSVLSLCRKEAPILVTSMEFSSSLYRYSVSLFVSVLNHARDIRLSADMYRGFFKFGVFNAIQSKCYDAVSLINLTFQVF